MKAWVQKARDILRGTLTPPKGELNELDWKLALSPDKDRIREHLSAYANYPGGGYLVFGISPDGIPATLSDAETTEIVSQLAHIGGSALEPKIQIDHECEDYESTRLLFVYIPESKVKPVHIRGKGMEESFIRSGATTRKASPQEIAAMLMNSRTPVWEELNSSPLLSDLEILEKLDLEPIFRLLEKPKLDTRPALMEWLVEQRFIQPVPAGGWYITNLGAISAAYSLNQFDSISRHAIRIIRYKGPTKITAIDEITGKRGYAVAFQNMIAYVMKCLPKSEVIEAALRTSKPVYPLVALREIIANALIHQDFSITGAGPTIELFDDRIEVTNPGKLLPSKQPDRLIGTQGESRNERLARTFRMYRICEERGSGLINAGLECELYGLPPIAFFQGENYFKVTLFSPRTFAQMTAKERLGACYQHSVLKYYSSSVMTNKSLRERLKMPEKQRSMVSLLIQQALEQGLIKAADPENKSLKFTEYLPYWA